jgi:hypothetical protein
MRCIAGKAEENCHVSVKRGSENNIGRRERSSSFAATGGVYGASA